MPLKVLNDSMFVKPCNFLNIDRVVDMKPDYRGWQTGLSENIKFNFVSFKTKKLQHFEYLEIYL